MNTDVRIESRRVFDHQEGNSNMPFFDGKSLVFCRSDSVISRTIKSEGRIWGSLKRNPSLAERFKNLPRSSQLRYHPWKLTYCAWDDKIARPIQTGLPDDGIECSPAFYWDGNRIYLSFIGGLPTNDGISYLLYSSSGVDFEHLTPAEPISHRCSFFGFISQHHICRGSGNSLLLTEKASGREFQLRTEFQRILRVTFLPHDPAKLLVTGLDRSNQHHTVVYELGSGKTSEVLSDGPVCESSLTHDLLVTSRKDEDAKNTVLYYSAFSLSPSRTQIYSD